MMGAFGLICWIIALFLLFGGSVGPGLAMIFIGFFLLGFD
jgi:hypothetical protein